MRRRDEILVGFTIIVALGLVVGGAIWLSEARIGQLGAITLARFRTVGGLGVGNPVVLRGVRVGRVSEISLGEGDWVETELQIYPGVDLPDRPGVIAASASLFGEWQAEIINLDDPVDDPNVRRELREAMEAGGDLWPGATLPDIGQLTAQAGRIATDIATVASRVQTTFDSTAVENMQGAIQDFGEVTNRINEFANEQTRVLGEAGETVRQGVSTLADAADMMHRTIARIDSATSQGEVEDIVRNAQQLSSELRTAVSSFRELVAVIQANQASIQRVMQGADTVVTRMQAGEGTVGRLMADSTLYVETLRAIEALQTLVEDIQANPRKYFKFSVF